MVAVLSPQLLLDAAQESGTADHLAVRNAIATGLAMATRTLKRLGKRAPTQAMLVEETGVGVHVLKKAVHNEKRRRGEDGQPAADPPPLVRTHRHSSVAHADRTPNSRAPCCRLSTNALRRSTR